MNPSIVKRCLVGAVLAIAATLPGFQQLHTSVEGLKLIADYEGCRLQPYQCSAGVWTDGIGNTSGVIPGKTITERQAAEGLISNVLRVERALERCVKQQPPQPEKYSCTGCRCCRNDGRYCRACRASTVASFGISRERRRSDGESCSHCAARSAD